MGLGAAHLDVRHIAVLEGDGDVVQSPAVRHGLASTHAQGPQETLHGVTVRREVQQLGEASAPAERQPHDSVSIESLAQTFLIHGRQPEVIISVSQSMRMR